MKKILLVLPVLLIATAVLASQTPFYAELRTVSSGELECERPVLLAGNSGNMMLRDCTQELIMEGDINGDVTFNMNMNIFALGGDDNGPSDGTVHIKSLISSDEQTYTMNINGRIVNSEIKGNFVIAENKRTIAIGKITGRVDEDPVVLIGKFVK